MYHWEANQEDFLMLCGEALLIVRGTGARAAPMGLRALHGRREHVIVGAGAGHCGSCSQSARDRSMGPEWGGCAVDALASRHGAGVEVETTKPEEAYARFAARRLTRYRDDWLPLGADRQECARNSALAAAGPPRRRNAPSARKRAWQRASAPGRRDTEPGPVGTRRDAAPRAERALGDDVVAVPVEERLTRLADRLERCGDLQVGRARDRRVAEWNQKPLGLLAARTN